MDLGSNYNRLKESISDISDSLTAKEVNSVTGLSKVPDEIRKISTYEKNTTYGIEITESVQDPYNRVGYLDDSVGKNNITIDTSTGKANLNEWERSWILKKVYPVMLKFNGEIDYRIDPNDYSKREDGNSSDISDMNYDGNAMVCFEKFYTKFSMDGSNSVIEISDTKKDGFEALGFIREDGSEADKIYLAMFGGSLDDQGRLRSISDQPIKFNITFDDSRIAAQKNGKGYDIDSWVMSQIYRNLVMIMIKSCDVYTSLGTGRGTGNTTTGIGNQLGPISCDPQTHVLKFMHCEDFLSSPYSASFGRWQTGIMNKNGSLFLRMKPPYSTSYSDYTQVPGYNFPLSSNQLITSMKCSNSYGRYPTSLSGNINIKIYEASTWITSRWNGSEVLVCKYGSSGLAGNFVNEFTNKASGNTYAALTYLPPA